MIRPDISNVKLITACLTRILGNTFVVKYQPAALLKQFLKAFSHSRFEVIWQVNGEFGYEADLPANVHLVKWVPLDDLFVHSNIQYAIIHGGINTVNEAVHSALPLIGIPLQGDQNSNLKVLETYRRIFSVGTHAVTTYNPEKLEITNQWKYDEFVSIRPAQRSPSSDARGDEFIILVRKKGKTDNMRFSSEFTEEILAQSLQFQDKFCEKPVGRRRFNGHKYGWSGDKQPVVIDLGPNGINQINDRGVLVKFYPYNHIRHIYRVADYPGGFVIEIGDQLRRHLFASQDSEEVIKELRQLALECMGLLINVAKDHLSFDDFMTTRLGLCSKDEQITSYVEFRVQKFTPRNLDTTKRLLCLSETCLIERDIQTYGAVCARFLKTIICLVRDPSDPQRFQIEYENGDQRTYSSNERDQILASLIDGSRASGNYQIFISSRRYERNLRLLPFKQLLDEEGEAQLLKQIVDVPPGLRRSDMVRRFNANVPYNGLTYSQPKESFFSDNTKSRNIVNCLEAVLAESYQPDEPGALMKCEAQMACLHRLFASKVGFQAFTAITGVREKLGNLVVNVLARKSEAIDYATVEMLCALMQPMHPNFELKLEQLNKQSLLSTKVFVEHLLDLVVNHVNRGTGALVIAAMLDFLTYTVCSPYSETTTGEVFDMIIELVAARGRSFYRLFHNPCLTIVKGAGLVMRAIIEESSREISRNMQTLSLTEGAFLKHLELALLSTGKDLRVLTNKQLSGHLISLWIAENSSAMDLLKRCLPRGLLDFFESPDKPPVSDKDLLLVRNNLEVAQQETQQSALQAQLKSMQYTVEARIETLFRHWNIEQKVGFTRKEPDRSARPVVLRQRKRHIRATANWKLFAYQFNKDHSQADLIWNEKTREEFRRAITDEMRQLQLELELVEKENTLVSWNHTEFFVEYPSLVDEIRIGDYYLRVLLNEETDTATPIHDPQDFFNQVYHRFLLASKTDLKCLCLRAMGIAYERHVMTIGPFNDSKHIVQMLARCMNVIERDHFLFLISKLVLDKKNVRDLISEGLIPMLVDMAMLAHLHINRAKIHSQTNVIEGGENTTESESEEWNYVDKEGKKHGPVSFKKMKELYKTGVIFEKTQIWAEGVDGWMNLSSVAQFRWTICAKDATQSVGQNSTCAPLYNLTDLAVLCLDVLNQMCVFFPSRDASGAIIRPMPKVKKIISEPVTLYQLVQLLLTYDPAIVQRVSTLVLDVMMDNPNISRLYLSGLYFFILMYNGSNVLPVAKLLHYTHLKQAFRSTLAKSEIISHSVLSPILPEATIYYLEAYGPERYAEVFLGEFENPEIIWNTDMRRHLIEKIAIHIADFSCRLTSNVKALYKYCPIPPIEYPQLDEELFCHYYYLRHLCDEQRFPNWEIREPIAFLRCVLAAWQEEIERKPSSMSIEDACKTLGLDVNGNGWQDTSTVRRAYYKLAPKYHPDKNPEGREVFVQINFAYEFLTSALIRNKNQSDPDVNRIAICLKTQSIIYSRNLEALSPYKYAGYTHLIRTIDLEASDSALFSSDKLHSGKLLSAAVELCYWTLKSSALNAEQLRRETGLEALYKTFERCVPMVSSGSKESDMPVQVCRHVAKCFGVAAEFEQCRDKISEMKQIYGLLCHLLKFEHLPNLAVAAAECICSFSVSTLLQTFLYQAGIIWHLLPHLFRFDYTLDEGGVQHNEQTNKQSVHNRLARSSAEALACLAGYRDETPENDGVQNSLNALITKYVCKLMKDGDMDEVLKVLNSNTEDPYIIWDNGTRAELLDFVEKQRNSPENDFGAEFTLSVYAKELIVGDIFVRIYNEQPEFKLYDAKSVCVDLVEYMKKQIDTLMGVKKPVINGNQQKKPPNPDNLIDFDAEPEPKPNPKESASQIPLSSKVEMVWKALDNVLLNYPGIEILLIGHFPLIFDYLRLNHLQNVQILALSVISKAANNKECVNDISCSVQLPLLLLLLVKNPTAADRILRTLVALSSNGTMVKNLLEFGGLLYLLHILMGAKGDGQDENRLLVAELLAKLQSDKLSGPRWSRFIVKYLPPIFADSLRDSPAQAIRMLDSNTENPELIWNDTIRATVRQQVGQSLQELLTTQSRDLSAKWSQTLQATNDQSTAYSSTIAGELIVGGVFIRLFNQNPSWNVRHPKQFATELMEFVLELMQKPNENLQPVTSALVSLITNHPTTVDQIPAQGYLPQFCRVMHNPNAESAKSALLILQQMAENQYCADSLASQPIIKGIETCMHKQPDLMSEAAHSLKCLTKNPKPELAEQFLKTDIIKSLLKVLSGELTGTGNISAAKAEIVDALKSICRDLQYGDRIQEILQKSTVWTQYKDQRHDLFLPASRTQAIAGPGGGSVAGYLTDRMFEAPPVPPPKHP
ncbi:unnamed protein product [Bursaphelenchus okinawaensis]|uniref:J domain-containing protein n=1 Tax=Bursaphelenchus okinawaensis TaxID=465554 RepID=A0A811JVS2_9BILA|nr:unnamed protein product [Bursaphelenchus okinawaensis]CAG9084662.1 unnamed protein product [Bursaphelenchus okinawaensis]